MKKIILGIITIMLVVAIFGCGKAQQASGGGSSGGGGGNGGGGGGGNETPQTFSIRGYVSVAAAQVSGMSVQDADTYSIKVLKFTDNSQWGGNTYTPRSSDGYYEISGLPLGTVFIVEAQKGQTKMRNLAFGSAGDKGQTKTADITPTSTVTVELISANAAETLKSFNENTDLTSVVEEVQAGVDTYYADITKLAALEDAINNGSIPDSIISAVENEVLPELECELTITAINGIVEQTPSPNSSGKYLKGAKVKLLAKNKAPWYFKQWSSGVDTNKKNKEITITLSGDKTISAEFVEGFVLWHWTTEALDEGQKKEFSPAPLARNQLRIWIEDDEEGSAFHDYEELVYAKNTEVTLTYTPVAYKGQPAPDVKDVVKVVFHGTTEPLEVDEQGHVANWDKAGRLSPDRYVNGEDGHNTTTINIDRNIVIRQFNWVNYDTYPLQDIQCFVDGDADEWDSLPEYPLHADIKRIFINSAKLGKDNDNLYVLIDYKPTDNQTLGYNIELREDIITLISEGNFDGSQLRRDVSVHGVNGDGKISISVQYDNQQGQIVGEADINRSSHTLEVRIPKTLVASFRNTETILSRISLGFNKPTNIDFNGGNLQRINF